MSELMHYGIKGMKWGVRRFQNKDGSLTNAGRRRLATDQSKNYVLPKGTVMYRGVRKGSKNFMNRDYTYVSVTDEYSTHNYNTSEGFYDGGFNTDFKLQSTRPLKIASTSDYFNAVMKANHINTKQYLNKVPKDVIDKGKYIIENDLLDHKLIEGDGGQYKAMNNAVKYLKRKGFDGVIDPVDGVTQIMNNEKPIATIIFNPKDNVEITKEIKRW